MRELKESETAIAVSAVLCHAVLAFCICLIFFFFFCSEWEKELRGWRLPPFSPVMLPPKNFSFLVTTSQHWCSLTFHLHILNIPHWQSAYHQLLLQCLYYICVAEKPWADDDSVHSSVYNSVYGGDDSAEHAFLRSR